MTADYENDMKLVKQYFEEASGSFDDDVVVKNYLKGIEILKKYYNPEEKDAERMQNIAYSINAAFSNMIQCVNDTEKGLAYCDDMIQIFPFEGRIEKAGYLKYKMKDFDGAINQYLECLAVSPDNEHTSSIYFNLILTYNSMKEYDKSFHYADEIIKINPVKGYQTKAEIWIETEKPEKAVEELLKALELQQNIEVTDGSKSQTLFQLIECYKLLNDTEKVLYYMDMKKECYSHISEFLYEKGQYLMSVKEYQKASDCFIEAANKMQQESYEPAWFNLDDIKECITDCKNAMSGKESAVSANLEAIEAVIKADSSNKFNYADLVQSLREQAEEQIPVDIDDTYKKSLLDLISNFGNMAGEALVQDKTLNFKDEQITFVIQVLAKYIFDKGVALIQAGVLSQKRDFVLQNIAFVIFEITKQSLLKNCSEKEILEAVENNVEKVYNDAIMKK